MRLPRVFQFEKYKTIDVKEFLSKGVIEIHLKRDRRCGFECNKCGHNIKPDKGSYRVRVQHMPIFTNHCYLIFNRFKGHCSNCKKVRSEKVNFISKESPHKSTDYSWWLGRMCEVTPVSQVARLCDESAMTTWRLDFKRMKRMLSKYVIPKVKRICVDEVYSRRKKEPGENHADLFFTVVCDLDTGRAIWVSSSRRKEALDEFFLIIGKKACDEIQVVACDMYRGYAASVEQYCSRAKIVWDRFHVMQSFDRAANEVRKQVHSELEKGDPSKGLSRGQYRFIFVKKSSKRTPKEQQHIEEAFKDNKKLFYLEMIKEKIHKFYNSKTRAQAFEEFGELGAWIWHMKFKPLMKWFEEMERGFQMLMNYFVTRATSGLAEGINNVIKTIKKSGYGYRNMQYFKLKILQVCGYLNSRYIQMAEI